MKKLVLAMAAMLLVVSMVSCASPPSSTSPYRPVVADSYASVVGTVQANFESPFNYASRGRLFNFRAVRNINTTARIALLEAARQYHRGDIDVKDISWVLVRRADLALHYVATGRVVAFDTEQRQMIPTPVEIENALGRAVNTIATQLTSESRIAIAYVSGMDRNTTDLITRELERILVGRNFTVVDRSELDRIRIEQQLGATLEVDDGTAARIGQFTGANVIMTSSVDGNRRLTIRAVSDTGVIIGIATEEI